MDPCQEKVKNQENAQGFVCVCGAAAWTPSTINYSPHLRHQDLNMDLFGESTVDAFSVFSQKSSKKEPEKRKSLSEEDGKKEIMKNDAQDGGPVAKKARVEEHKVAAKTAKLVANGDGAASEKQPPQKADTETPAEESVAEPDRSYQLCKHDVMIPPGYQGSLGQDLYNPPFPESPARQYPFTLDPFQVLHDVFQMRMRLLNFAFSPFFCKQLPRFNNKS